MRSDDISEIYRHPEKRMRCLLVPFLFLVGLVGGAIGGVIAPMTIDGWSFRIPGRIVILAGVLGAAIGLLPGLLSGIVAYFVSKLQSHREIAVLLHLLMAMVAFCLAFILSGLAMGFLYLVSLGDC